MMDKRLRGLKVKILSGKGTELFPPEKQGSEKGHGLCRTKGGKGSWGIKFIAGKTGLAEFNLHNLRGALIFAVPYCEFVRLSTA